VRIENEGILDQCIGLLAQPQTLIRREAVAEAAMTGRLSPRPEGPRAGGVPPLEGGPGAGALEVP
jgi:hypothetical protein